MLDEWIRRMTAAKVLMGDTSALVSELSAWIELIDRGEHGESWAETELMRLVSFHARNLGADGHAASAALTQVTLLEEVFEERGRRAGTRRITLKMMHLVADAHEAGMAQRLAARHRSEFAKSAPVIRLGERAVLGFLGGPLHAELLDALFGRVLRECARIGAHIAVIDTSGTRPEDDLFYRTVDGMQRLAKSDKFRIILTGATSVETIKSGLLRSGANLERILVKSDVSEVIAELA